MTEQSAAAPADKIETVPVAALSAVKAELDATNELSKAKDAEIAALKARAQAAEALAKKLDEARAAAELKAEAASSAANFSRASSKARYRIIIDEARDKSEPRKVPVQVNGRAYEMQRMVPIDVPLEVVSVLNDAILGRAEPVLDPRTGIEAGVQYVQARRFPFQTLGQSRDDDGNYINGFKPLE